MLGKIFTRKYYYILLLLIAVIMLCSVVVASEGELIEERTMFSKKILNNDGTVTMDFSSNPMFYKNEEGELEEINTDLEAIRQVDDKLSTAGLSDGSNLESHLTEYDYKVTKNVMETYFSSRTGKVKVQLGEDWFTMKPVGIGDIVVDKEKTGGNTLYLSGLWTGNDLVYKVMGGMVKEDIIIKSSDSINKYIFDIMSPSLSIKNGKNGELNFINEEGKIVLTLPAPFMKDSSEPSVIGKAEYNVVESRDDYKRVEISLDKDWFNRDDIQYPVVIDPTASVNYGFDREEEFTIQYEQTISWSCYLSGVYTSSSAYFYIFDPDGDTEVARSHDGYGFTLRDSGTIEADTGTWKVEALLSHGMGTARGSVTYQYDTSGPSINSFKINNGASTTTSRNVSLNISAVDNQSGLADRAMCFSNNGRDYSNWEPYKSRKSWSLAGGDGTKRVYIKMRDKLGNISTRSDTIKYDTTGPDLNYFTINNGASQTNSSDVTLNISASDNLSGVYQMCFSNDNSNFSGWQSYRSSRSWTLASGDGYKRVYVKLKDGAGNISSYYTSSILLDETAPWPDGGLDPELSINLREGTATVEETIKDAYLHNDKLEYIFSWNRFIDTDSEHPVYSGFKEHMIAVEYLKGGSTTTLSDIHQAASSILQEVEWNSRYRFRVKGVDNAGNNSSWYPENDSYVIEYTPSRPTEIKDIYFDGNQAVVEFYTVGDDAESYRIKWKERDSIDDEYNNSTDWIIPVDKDAETYTYTIPLSRFSFSYGVQYQFTIGTKNINDTLSVYLPSDLTAMPNRPPYSPTINHPAVDEGYFTSSTVYFDGLNRGDPDGQQVSLSFKIDKREIDSRGNIFWERNVKQLNSSSGNITFEDGHYRCRLIAFDGLDTNVSSREFYIDTTKPIQPLFEIQSEDGSEYTDKTALSIKLIKYEKEYSPYPFPEDNDRINDLKYFVVSSNLDESKTIERVELVDSVIDYTLKQIDGEHKITVTSYDEAGNSNSNTRSIVFDNKAPEVINLTEPYSQYFDNTDSRVIFNWPDALDRPVGDTAKAGIKLYQLRYERPGQGITDTVDLYQSDFNINLNYNEPVFFQVRAEDNAGNKQLTWSDKVNWYSKAEPIGILNHVIIIEEEAPGSGIYRQKVNLTINSGSCKYYKVYSLNITDGDNHVQEDISDSITDIWNYNYEVDAHQIYKFYINSFNELELVTDGLEADLAYNLEVPNNLPTTPEIAIVGGLNQGYLNSSSAEITISSTDIFGNTFSKCIDYDHDDLNYHFMVRENDEMLIDMVSSDTSYQLTDLNDGSSYEIKLEVTDNIGDNNGEIKSISANTISFKVDTEKPLITMTEPDTDYVASKSIQINASDSESGIASIKYKWGEAGTLKPLPVDNTIEAPHGYNSLIVIVVDNAGNISRLEKEYLVDLTEPVIESVIVQDTQQLNGDNYITNNNIIYTDINFDDDLTGIVSYHYGIIREGESVSSLNPDDLIEVEVDCADYYQGEQEIVHSLEDGYKYYPVFMVTNDVGRSTPIQKVDPGFYVDGSSPVIDALNIEGISSKNNQFYLTDLSLVNMTPQITDDETGIKSIKYSIVKSSAAEVEQWFDSFEDVKNNIQLEEGKRYYFTVQAENGVNMQSIRKSSPFLVDTVGPVFKKIAAGKEIPEGTGKYIQRRNDFLEVSWAVDDISALDGYYYKIGTDAGSGNISKAFAEADDGGWITHNSTKYEESIRISRDGFTFDDGIYYITIRAVDEAGNETSAVSNPLEIDTQLAAVPTIITSGRYLYERDKIYFTIEMKDPEQDITGYQYRIVDESGNIVYGPEETVTGELIKDVELTDVSLLNGVDYYIYVRAHYRDNTYTEEGFTVITIDSTRPENLTISSPDYTSNKELIVSWQAEEDYSNITYQLKLGTEVDKGDILEWIDCGRKEQYLFTDLNLEDGQIIYAAVRAENSSGLWTTAVSKPIIIDNTEPPVPLLIDEGMYSTDDNSLKIDWRWTEADTQSGISGYQAALLTSRIINEGVDWVSLEADVTNYTFNEQLVNGERYFAAVKSVNGAGLSSIAISDGIVIDTTKPEPPQIDDKRDYTDSLTTLIGEFSGAEDPESGLASFYYSLGTYSELDLLVDEEEVSSTVVGGNNFNLQTGEVYFFQARAENNAGLLSALTTSNGLMVIDPDKPLITQVNDSGDYSNTGRELSFSWKVDEARFPADHFEYVLLADRDQPINESDWIDTSATRITVKASELHGDGSYFTDGTQYYLAVRAVNMLGTPTAVKMSDGIIVDSTLPETIVLHTDQYSNERLHLRWDCNDPDSDIKGYLYAVGTDRGGSDVTNGWCSIDNMELNENESSKRIDRYITLDLKHQGRYYLTVKAVNGAGLWSIPAMSSLIIGDREAPAKPEVFTEFRNTPDYTNDRTKIEDIFFRTSDNDSGIIGYRCQVVDSINNNVDLTADIIYLEDSTRNYENDDLDISNLSLEEEGIYYAAVQSMDSTGNWSEVGYSQAVEVDTISADLKFALDIEELVTNDGRLAVGWMTNEAGRLYYRLLKLDDNGLPVNNPDYEEIEVIDFEGSFNFEVDEYGRYQYQIYQKDLAANGTEVIKQNVRYNRPPEVTIYGDRSTYKGHIINFTSQVIDDTQLNSYTWKVRDYEEIQRVGIDDSVGEFDYRFAETGNYIIELTVEDEDGASTTENIEVLITNTLEGKLLVDENWSGTMNMRGTVQVPEVIRLVIEPGTSIHFPDGSYLIIDGVLAVNGDSSQPVIFTGTFWKGISINPTASVGGIDFTIIRNADRGLIVDNQNVSIKNSSFIENQIGIQLFNKNIVVNNCLFDSNIYYGIKEEMGGEASVIDSIFENNGIEYYQHRLFHLTEEELNSMDGNSGNIYQ